MSKKIEKFIEALEHTPALFYLPESIIVLDKYDEEGFIEIRNEEFVEEFNMEPGDDEFFKRFLLPQEMKGHMIDYHIIPSEQEKAFREALEEFIKTVQR